MINLLYMRLGVILTSILLVAIVLSVSIPSAYALVPDKVTGVTATTGDGTITLTWDEPNSDPIIDYYSVKMKHMEGKRFTVITTPNPTITFDNLINGDKYKFWVTAINADGTSVSSVAAFASPTADIIVPTSAQPNAFASYNNATHQVKVSWDFNTLPSDTRCFLKGDIVYHKNMNVGIVYTKAPSFIPTYYSAVTPTPAPLQAVDQDQQAEEIPCTGNTRIDMESIMSHSTNTENYPDLEIFLTFYVPNSDGNFQTANELRIDEVMVGYNSNTAFNQVTKDYICGGQIGSTLYIDQSGSAGSTIAHGNNGDNCDVYLYLENDEYVDIGMSGIPSHGVASYGFHDSDIPLLYFVNYSTATEDKKTGGGNEWDTRPTFGLNHKTQRPVVECGFSFDTICYDITDNWHTDFDKIQINTGETHTATINVLAEKKLKYLEFQLGVPEVGHGQKAEVIIFADIDHQGYITDFGVNGDTDSTNILGITIDEGKCQESDTIAKCDFIAIVFESVEPLQNDVIGLQAIDYENRVQTTYLNEGINFSGDSLNPMDIDTISGTKKYEGQITVTQASKYSEIWVADDGREFQRNDSGSFVWINEIFKKSPSPEMSVMNRMHSEYYKLIDIEQDKALLVFDSEKLISLTPDSWRYAAPVSAEIKQAELNNRITNEIDRITPLTKDYTLNQHLYQKDSYDHWNHFSDMTVSQINQLDLEKKLKFQEEIYQQKLEVKSKYD